MRYYIVKHGANGVKLFLADRGVTKSRWWTETLIDAFAFKNENAAKRKALSLSYGKIDVVDRMDAEYMAARNDELFNDDHPFSSEGLGQWT